MNPTTKTILINRTQKTMKLTTHGHVQDLILPRIHPHRILKKSWQTFSTPYQQDREKLSKTATASGVENQGTSSKTVKPDKDTSKTKPKEAKVSIEEIERNPFKGRDLRDP